MKKINAYLAMPRKDKFQPVADIIKKAAVESNVAIKTLDSIESDRDIISALINQLYLSDLAIVDVSEPNPMLFYEIGIAHAIGKPVLFLLREDTDPPVHISRGPYIKYSPTEEGLQELRRILNRAFHDFRVRPRLFLRFLGAETYRLYPPYIIDLDKLEPRDFENLCFELLTQMGFKKIRWLKGIREVDAVAILPRKDPDGFEYNELWFVFMGTRRPIELIVDILRHEPEMFFGKILKEPEILRDMKYRFKTSDPITILLILKESEPPVTYLEKMIRTAECRAKEMGYPVNFRIRLWSPEHLISLIQQYPHIAYKYFSEEVLARKKYRKTPEELYRENVELTEKLQIMLAELEEEKKKRFIAERDAAWKDVAFKAAHKLGNPIDAIETFLGSLKKRIERKNTDEALDICQKMERSIEEAKNIIAQFKSLTKVQEINPRPINIKEIIEQASKMAEHKGVKIKISCTRDLKIYADPDRILEVFNELIANSIHWLDKDERIIRIEIRRAKKIPSNLDPANKYIKIVFEDNGKGIPIEEKEKIFAPFYTTYPHGTGLGLAMVKWVVEAHSGTIYEDGKPGEGARFNIFLPIKGGE